MTRKNYRSVAEGIKHVLDSDENPIFKRAVAATTRSLAEEFKRDNSNFRYDKFYEACGLDSFGEVKE